MKRQEVQIKIIKFQDRRRNLQFNQGIAVKLGFDEQALKLQSDASLISEFIDILQDIERSMPEESKE